MVHGFQLLDIWMHHSAGDAASCQSSKIFNMSSAGDSADNFGFQEQRRMSEINI